MMKSPLLRSTAFALAVATIGPAFPAQAAEAERSGSAWETAEQTAGEGLTPIVVSARRRLEDAQDVPAAISVFSVALLDWSYTVETNLLSQLVPSLNYSSANPRKTAFTIRGLG